MELRIHDYCMSVVERRGSLAKGGVGQRGRPRRASIDLLALQGETGMHRRVS